MESLFAKPELSRIRSKFLHVASDFSGEKRLFFDNAGGSLRLARAEQAFAHVDSIPDCSEHSNRVARHLDGFEREGRRDLMECVFNARHGILYPSYSASQIMMELCRVFAENARGTNVVVTQLEHPSSYDGMKHYAEVHGREFRVAPVNPATSGVDADDIIARIDRHTAILSCMYASNISGYVFDLERICRAARKANPDIIILCDAVQHAPHAALDPEAFGIDAMTFAPYKFFGVRGFAVAYISDRCASFMHHRLLAKAADDWSLGSPAPAHYVAISEIVSYVMRLGNVPGATARTRRELFARGMGRIAAHERALLRLALEGTDTAPGLRSIPGVTVRMDGSPLEKRDFIIGIEFDNIGCEEAVAEYEKRGVIVFERSAKSLYSRRMVEAFGSQGVVRVSPLHVHGPGDIARFLHATREIAKTTPTEKA